MENSPIFLDWNNGFCDAGSRVDASCSWGFPSCSTPKGSQGSTVTAIRGGPVAPAGLALCSGAPSAPGRGPVAPAGPSAVAWGAVCLHRDSSPTSLPQHGGVGGGRWLPAKSEPSAPPSVRSAGTTWPRASAPPFPECWPWL